MSTAPESNDVTEEAEASLPEWLSAEADVQALFRLFGFETYELNHHGRQIDIRAQRPDPVSIEPEKWAIEVTCEKVGNTKGSKDGLKLVALQKQGYKTLIVSTKGFAGPTKETLQTGHGIRCMTYAELERSHLDLGKYAIACKAALEQAPDSDIGFDHRVYIDSRVRVHRNPENEDQFTEISAADWVAEVCSSEAGVLGALLGNLGTGKTTILQRAQHRMLSHFLREPSDSVVPIMVPLSRYRHHSGRVDSLLHEVFGLSGLATYPTQLIKHLAKHGRIVFFFDGLDEVHPISSIDDVVATVRNVLDYLGRDIRAIVSSRTHLFATSAEEFAIFGPYERNRLAKVAHTLGRLLAGHATTEIAYVQPFSKTQVEEYLKTTCGVDEYKEVIRHVNTIYGFRDMARTPVLLAMMRRTIPELVRARTGFGPYPQVDLYRAYVGRWIERDTGRAQLSRNQRESLSISLAKDLIQRDEFRAPWSEIMELLRSQPTWSETPIPESAAEMDVRNSTFLVREHEENFAFVHRSIMEFLAAMDSFRRVRAGEGAEHSLSDGHANFLAMLFGEAWAKDGDVPVPRRTLDLDRWEDAELWSTLQAATHSFPVDATPLRLADFRISGSSLPPTYLRRTSLVRTSFDVEEIERLKLEYCSLESVNFATAESGPFELGYTETRGSTLTAPSKVWRKVRFYPDLNTSLAPLSVPAQWEAVFRWCDGERCSAAVGNASWDLGLSNCAWIAAIAGRLRGKVKLSVESWVKGPKGSALEKALPKLRRDGWVSEDTSRRPHQLAPTDKLVKLFGGLETDPPSVRDEAAALLNCLNLAD